MHPLPGRLRKNDALFLYGAMQPLPFVYAYAQDRLEVVHGPSCVPEREILLDRCGKDGVPVVERRGGGGTVVLAPGMVITIAVGERLPRDGIRDVFSRIHRAMIPILAPLVEAPISEAGISDIAVKGRKILGSSLYLSATPPVFYYQSSLIVDTDVGVFENYLAHPPREPEYRQGRTHGAFCTSLREEGCRKTAEEVSEAINRQLGGGIGLR